MTYSEALCVHFVYKTNVILILLFLTNFEQNQKMAALASVTRWSVFYATGQKLLQTNRAPVEKGDGLIIGHLNKSAFKDFSGTLLYWAYIGSF
jgi:adenosine deaminase